MMGRVGADMRCVQKELVGADELTAVMTFLPWSTQICVGPEKRSSRCQPICSAGTLSASGIRSCVRGRGTVAAAALDLIHTHRWIGCLRPAQVLLGGADHL